MGRYKNREDNRSKGYGQFWDGRGRPFVLDLVRDIDVEDVWEYDTPIETPRPSILSMVTYKLRDIFRHKKEK